MAAGIREMTTTACQAGRESRDRRNPSVRPEGPGSSPPGSDLRGTCRRSARIRASRPPRGERCSEHGRIEVGGRAMSLVAVRSSSALREAAGPAARLRRRTSGPGLSDGAGSPRAIGASHGQDPGANPEFAPALDTSAHGVERARRCFVEEALEATLVSRPDKRAFTRTPGRSRAGTTAERRSTTACAGRAP
jgi:hypothetical protein